MMNIMQTDSMELDLLVANKALAILKISGVIDLDTSEDVLIGTRRIIDDYGSHSIIFDVADVSYVSSAGVGVFMSLFETLEQSRGQIIFVQLNDSFRRVLMLLGFMRYFPAFESHNEAQDFLMSEIEAGVEVA